MKAEKVNALRRIIAADAERLRVLASDVDDEMLAFLLENVLREVRSILIDTELVKQARLVVVPSLLDDPALTVKTLEGFRRGKAPTARSHSAAPRGGFIRNV